MFQKLSLPNRVLSMNIPFAVAFPSTKSLCSAAIPGFILFPILIMTIHSSIFVTWLIRLMALWFSYSTVLGFLGSVTKVDFKRSVGMIPV